MPAAKRSTRSSSRTSKFKEPAAFKRLTKSLDTAQEALAELSKSGGRDVGESAGAVYKDLRTFLSNARRHSGRLGKALARDFDKAQKQLAKATPSGTSRTTSARGRSSRAGSSRTTSSKRGSASRSRSTRTTPKRASSTRK